MALLDLWNADRQQITGKRIDQLIAFAGEGRLRDGNTTSEEFRTLLKAVSSDVIGQWLNECLENRFTDFGFVLQDTVNEVGRRLGFDVTHGVYRSHSNEGYDGLWRIPGGRAILAESKSSTSYSIALNRISEYRKQVAPQLGLRPEDISILIVVGTEDTSEFEAQVRGSRFAWDIRILGVQALYRLLKLKEALDDPKVERQIQEILFPQEFTRLDRIIDLVFATAEDAQDFESTEEEVEVDDSAPEKPRANFHAAILPRLEKHFGQPLVKRSRSQWATPDDASLVSCQVSKHFDKGNADFWFGLKRTSRETLQKHKNAFCAFGLGSPDRVVVLPMSFLAPHVDSFFTSPDKEGGILHWHVRFVNTNTGVAMLVDRDRKQLDVTKYLLKE
ncbi:hypothetical protein Spb1_22600 [Planctopirus ephydatiae]|uniref:Restriction endonuclease n=1 Tax=Planctopirus ephydatiae TaxID=2528019 RepID=A0A518GPD9_9PLAN|nr:hypothetical protein Spb1_22600 [Planctopirus ephydatiae]